MKEKITGSIFANCNQPLSSLGKCTADAFARFCVCAVFCTKLSVFVKRSRD